MLANSASIRRARELKAKLTGESLSRGMESVMGNIYLHLRNGIHKLRVCDRQIHNLDAIHTATVLIKSFNNK